jgi:hypothetical protein
MRSVRREGFSSSFSIEVFVFATDYDVYLCYGHQDRLMARLMRGYLRGHNISSWFDEEHFSHHQEHNPESVKQKLRDAIARCDSLLLLLSPDTRLSPWVKFEIETAKELNMRRMAAVVRPIDESLLPDWLQYISRTEIFDVKPNSDELRGLRENIADNKPTYIAGRLAPSIVKQSRIDRLDNHLAKCKKNDLSLWFLNGNLTVATYIIPTIEDRLRKFPDVECRCRALFLDSPHVSGAELDPGEEGVKFQDFFESRLVQSNFMKRPHPHHVLLGDTMRELDRVRRRFPNFTIDVRLTPILPPGRLILADGEYGFCGPYWQVFNAQLPMFVFDRHSPLFEKLSGYFEEAYTAARPMPAGLLTA